MTERLDACTFTIPGRLAGKGRPRATLVGGHARLYTPDSTVKAEDRVRDAWRAAGAPWFAGEPLCMDVTLNEQRPKGHWRADGSLNASGLRNPVPMRRPDLDNIWKLIADALQGAAYVDDKQFVEVHIRRLWLPAAGLQESACVEMWIPYLAREPIVLDVAA